MQINGRDITKYVMAWPSAPKILRLNYARFRREQMWIKLCKLGTRAVSFENANSKVKWLQRSFSSGIRDNI